MDSMPNTSTPTLNRCGRTTRALNEYARMFVEYASSENSPVLDVGAAFGVATLPALKKGAVVIANDIDIRHLDIITRNVAEGDRERLRVVLGMFPSEVHFDDASLAAILASNVLNFLSGPEITRGVEAMYRWLKPGGKVFVIAGTPYAQNVKGFIPEYEARRERGNPWPGECDDIRAFSAEPTIDELPSFLHLLDDTVLRRAFHAAGFYVERVEMFLRAGLPEYLRCDGRENVGLVAHKPGLKGEQAVHSRSSVSRKHH